MHTPISAPLVIELKEVPDVAGHQHSLLTTCKVEHEIV